MCSPHREQSITLRSTHLYHQDFTYQTLRSRPNIPRRSHTMKAYLPSTSKYRKGRMDLESSSSNQEAIVQTT